MAVFTEVSAPALAQWLEKNTDLRLAAGPEPVTEGIENTNYTFVADNGRKHMFTVLEVWDRQRAEYCARLASHLHRAGQPAPAQTPVKGDCTCPEFAGKPALVVEFVEGTQKRNPAQSDCAKIAAALAGLHQAAADFSGDLPNPRGHQWRLQAANRILPSLDAKDRLLLERALEADRACDAANLPECSCHCDLFRNNVLWKGNNIAAIIDFYFAGHDRLLFDLAVAAADWCFDEQGLLDQEKLSAFAVGYNGVRQLTVAEKAQVADMFAAASLRFWLSRLDDRKSPRTATILVEHNPDVFRNRLATCLEVSETIREAFA